ncbi:MAG TPA: glycine cleavage system protein GcvH [Acidimicrobiales bacterium]|nr:glycine cleavage system protein GcvH [Acidimicrobiales bacterium]
MSTVNQCDIPEELYYLVEKHVWARLEGDTVVVGLSDVAQNLAKTIISGSLKDPGRVVRKGKSVATVESGKWVGPVPSPVTGEIVEVNEALRSAPATLNADPYGSGWVARIRCEDWQADSADLLTGPEAVEAYRAFLDAEGIRCGE